jgi:3-oxoacyl-[acyl-carrier-protein] synthase-3
MLPVKIAGLGVYLPRRCVASKELEARMGLPDGWVERTTGVRERRRADGETTAGMAARAARQALEHAEVLPEQIDLVLGASAAPQQMIPCTAALVHRELGLPEGRSRCWDVNATCLSFLASLHTAAHLIGAGVYRKVLIFSSEIVHAALDPCEPESAVLLGDAAVAAVVTACGIGETSGIGLTRLITYSGGADLTVCLGGGSLHHPNDPATTPTMNFFHMDGPAIYRLAARLLGPFLDRYFADLGWDRADVNAVVPHQASSRGLELLTKRFGFRPGQVVQNLALRGNCVAASLPLALAEAVHAGRIRRGHKVVLIGTGAGLTLGALALTY